MIDLQSFRVNSLHNCILHVFLDACFFKVAFARLIASILTYSLMIEAFPYFFSLSDVVLATLENLLRLEALKLFNSMILGTSTTLIITPLHRPSRDLHFGMTL